MRIAVAHSSFHRIGGIETYLERLLPELAGRGHRLAFCHEWGLTAGQSGIRIPSQCPRIDFSAEGMDRGIERLKDWKPDILFAHALENVPLQERLIDLAPGVLFLHTYAGTCISGTKCNQWPAPRPCSRRFGPACLVRYYPMRCGGWNPVTMLQMYRRQASARDVLHRFDRIVTHSRHMADELVQNGVPADRVTAVSFFVPGPAAVPGRLEVDVCPPRESETIEILFVGRADPLKGGAQLIEAAPSVARILDRRVRLTLACDGGAMTDWRRAADRSRAIEPRLRIDFVGWLDEAGLAERYRAADLLAVPSVWPEPFGQVGVEAGHWGVPAVGYDLGGIREWLTPGLNGELASAEPPTVPGLRDAVCRCFRSDAHHRSLRVHAARVARGFASTTHVDRLETVFSETIDRRAKPGDSHIDPGRVASMGRRFSFLIRRVTRTSETEKTRL